MQIDYGKHNGGTGPADPIVHLLSNTIDSARRRAKSGKGETRRRALQWIFSEDEHSFSIRWCCERLADRMEDLHGRRMGPSPESVRRDVLDAIDQTTARRVAQ